MNLVVLLNSDFNNMRCTLVGGGVYIEGSLKFANPSSQILQSNATGFRIWVKPDAIVFSYESHILLVSTYVDGKFCGLCMLEGVA